MTDQLFTIGHSNLPLDRFVELLRQHNIETLVDVRRFPGSRKWPHFNRESLATALEGAGIEYHWMEALGGRRPKAKGESQNLGLENESFRNYADYMLAEEFREAAKELLELAEEKRTAIMCAEAVYWRCHRRLVSDYLLASHVAVQHIFSDGKIRPHDPTPGAKIGEGKVTYPGEPSLFT